MYLFVEKFDNFLFTKGCICLSHTVGIL
uniref:BLTX402 n=1 Tax=Nephila pilipes TaxID=299642 RepID=A0A076L024_NEPPI|nr:BLTX402 [Nephila pilipes]